MPERLNQTWVYLSASPLFWLTMTLVAYQLAFQIYRRCGQRPIANPVLISIVLLVSLLTATGTPYDQYFEGAQFVHFLLGPATVALAIPLYGQFRRLVAMAGPLAIALIGGSLTAMLGAVMVIVTGILGAMVAQTLYRRLNIRDDAVAGFALGVTAHGIGTARAFQINETMGAFAALGMGLNGLLTAITLPGLISWIKPWLQ